MRKRRNNYNMGIEYIVEEFEHMFPWVKGHIVKTEPFEHGEIISFIDDGSVVVYDYVARAAQSAKSYDELMKRRRPTDDEARKMLFADRLYRAMMLSHMTQEELADYAGVSTGAISSYMNGSKMPTVTVLWRLCEALECSPDDLIKF